MTHIYLDIETIPAQTPDVITHVRESIKAPSNYKDPDKIAAYIDESATEALLKTSFDGAYGHIVCVSVAIDNQEPVSFSSGTVEGEAFLLDDLFLWLSENTGEGYTSKTFIGHNIIGFDLPFLRKRSMILDIRPPAFIPFHGKPWELNPFDTMTQWDAKNFCGLDKLLKAFNIGSKGDVDGSMVYEMWKDGKHDEIAAYCRSDVENTRKLYKRMTYAV